jgi:hypothetical protein
VDAQALGTLDQAESVVDDATGVPGGDRRAVPEVEGAAGRVPDRRRGDGPAGYAIAAQISVAPEQGGRLMRQRIEVREVLRRRDAGHSFFALHLGNFLLPVRNGEVYLWF